MKLKQAIEIINGEPAGFMVAFEKVNGKILETDMFPDIWSGESPIPDENEAWTLAQAFANKTRGKYVNIYVIRAKDFTPVPGAMLKMIRNR